MQDYIIEAMKSRGYVENDFIGCEICGAQSVEVHHILSSMKSKRKTIGDGSTLIFLCRSCHNRIHNHNNQKEREILLCKVKKILDSKNKDEG